MQCRGFLAASIPQRDRYLPRPPHGSCRPFDDRAGAQNEIGKLAKPFLKRDADFHARQVRADAAMNTKTERCMPILGPINDDPIRIRKHRRVAIGHTERQHDHLSVSQPTAADLRLLDDFTTNHHGSIGPQKFLDRGWNQVRLFSQALSVILMGGEMPQAGADHAPGRIDAGDKQQTQCAADMLLIQRLSVEPGVEQVADEIIARRFPTFGDFLRKECIQLGKDTVDNPGIRNPKFQQIAHPFPKSRALELGDAEHTGCHARRYFLRIFHGNVALAPVRKRFQEFTANGSHSRLKLSHGLRREWRQKYPPVISMRGRIGGDRRGWRQQLFALADCNTAR